MPLSMRQALDLAEPLRKSRIVAGEAGLDRPIQSVNVMEVPEILEWVRPGELLVTTLYPLRDSPGDVENLIPMLAEQGLAGLAVTPSEYFKEIPECMIQAADELGFPIIELPPKVSFIDIIQPLTSEILSLQANQLMESERIHRQFIDLVLTGGLPSDIAQGIAQLVGCPVSIVGRFQRVLGTGIVIGQAQVQRPFLENTPDGSTYLNDGFSPEFVSQIEGTEASLMRLRSDSASHMILLYPVKVGRTSLGRIIVWGPIPTTPNPMDLIAIEHGATVAALKIMENRAIQELEERYRNEILEGLTSGQPIDRQRALQRSRQLGHKLSAPYLMLMIGPDPGTEGGKALSMTEIHNHIEWSLSLARSHVLSLNPASTCWYSGTRLVVFVPIECAANGEVRDFDLRQLKGIIDWVASENPPFSLSSGVSRPTHKLDDFPTAYEQARKALELGASLGSRSQACVTRYDDLGLFQFMSPGEPSMHAYEFVHENIGSLMDYDRDHGTELVKTIRVYLEESQNISIASKRLFIHYNTLRYRLDSVRKLIGDALDHPHRRLAIELAIQMHNAIAADSSVNESS